MAAASRMIPVGPHRKGAGKGGTFTLSPSLPYRRLSVMRGMIYDNPALSARRSCAVAGSAKTRFRVRVVLR